MQNWSFICAIIEIALELLTIGSILMIFVRMKSKKDMRKSERYAALMRAPYGQGPHGYEEPSTPNMAYHELDSKSGYRPEKG
jgi:hypothetical protein